MKVTREDMENLATIIQCGVGTPAYLVVNKIQDTYLPTDTHENFCKNIEKRNLQQIFLFAPFVLTGFLLASPFRFTADLFPDDDYPDGFGDPDRPLARAANWLYNLMMESEND